MTSPFNAASLYVGDLHPDVTESVLYDKFHAVGQIHSIRICRDAITKKSLGYGYVNYHSRNDASRALDTLNFTDVMGKPIRIMWQQRDPSIRRSGVGNVFIKNLDPEIDSKILMDTFSQFGNILSCKVIKRNRKTTIKNEKNEPVTISEDYGCGFVHFETQEAADAAINNVNDKLIKGKKVYVAPFLRREEREKTSGGKVTFTNVYIKNIESSVSDEEFMTFMGKFGKVQNCQIMRTLDGKSRGFGFCNYFDPESAQKAVEELNGKEYKNLQLFAGKAEGRDERKKKLSKIYEQRKQEKKAKSKGLNLYIKNLDETMNDEILKENFSKFGPVTSCVVMKDKKSNASKGFGFVCFEKQTDAIKAQNEMNGKMISNKPLYVSFAQTKEERRLFLERQSRGMIPHGPSMQGAIPSYAMYPFPRGPAPGFPQMGPQMIPAGAPQNMQSRGRGGWIYPMAMPQMFPPKTNAVPGRRMMNMGPHRGRGSYKLNQNARNTQQKQSNHPQQPQQPQPEKKEIEQVPVEKENEPTETVLTNMSEEQQKQFLGLKLYPFVQQIHPDDDIASRITGMLLEMDNYDILHLIENQEALNLKIDEAHTVLKSASEGNEGEN